MIGLLTSSSKRCRLQVSSGVEGQGEVTAKVYVTYGASVVVMGRDYA